jgi:hypothetical protein
MGHPLARRSSRHLISPCGSRSYLFPTLHGSLRFFSLKIIAIEPSTSFPYSVNPGLRCQVYTLHCNFVYLVYPDKAAGTSIFGDVRSETTYRFPSEALHRPAKGKSMTAKKTLFKIFTSFGPLESGYLVDLVHLVDLGHLVICHRGRS